MVISCLREHLLGRKFVVRLLQTWLGDLRPLTEVKRPAQCRETSHGYVSSRLRCQLREHKGRRREATSGPVIFITTLPTCLCVKFIRGDIFSVEWAFIARCRQHDVLEVGWQLLQPFARHLIEDLTGVEALQRATHQRLGFRLDNFIA